MSSKFTTLMFVKGTPYSAHGYNWEIKIYKVEEDGSYKIFVSTQDGSKGDALFIVESSDIQNAEANIDSLINLARKDIDENEDNKYGL